MKRFFVLAGLVGIVLTATHTTFAQGQNFPTREVTLVVGYTAGGPMDGLARVIGDRMSNALGQRVIIENRAGVNGAIATRAVAKSAADGYTLIFNSSNMATNLPGLKEPGYKWDDFDIVGGMSYGPMVMVVNTASSKAKTLQEFVAFGKANPGKLTFASFGPQSIQNVVAQRLNDLSGIGWRGVPYKGGAQITPDLINGNVDAYFGFSVFATSIKDQPNIAILAVANTQRIDTIPNVPTFAEAGFPGVNDGALSGIWAPAGTPKPILDKLRGAMAEAMKAPDLKGLIGGTGNILYQGTPAQFDADIRRQADQYRDAFKKLGIEPE
jgi:tripartite-type tricarboxylate transporter receptor subunit TctC